MPHAQGHLCVTGCMGWRGYPEGGMSHQNSERLQLVFYLARVSQQAPELMGELLNLCGDYLCVLSQLQHAGHCLLV